MDGGQVTAPNFRFYTAKGWEVENTGVAPDVEVEQSPADVLAGHDPQLEKAIEIALKALEKDSPTKVTRPPYPTLAKPGRNEPAKIGD
jgi:tricorn protease